jgi:hypothetical protein
MENAQNDPKMQDNPNNERWLKRLRVIGWSLVACLLMLPAIAMQFNTGVDWSISDFIFAGVLLIGTGLLVELLVRKSRSSAYRAGAVVALGATLLLIWCNAAVGFVGAGANAANVLYAVLTGSVAIWSLAVGFRAKGMSNGMFAAAIAQGLITVLAYAMHLVREEETFIIPVINGFFIALWLVAALLFRKAARPSSLGNKLHLLLSLLLLLVGLSFMAYMIIVESEPGAVPLILVLTGIAWFFTTLVRSRASNKSR